MLFSRGYVLRGDMVFVPDQPWKAGWLGLDGRVPRFVPGDAFVWLLGVALPGDLVQKLVLLRGARARRTRCGAARGSVATEGAPRRPHVLRLEPVGLRAPRHRPVGGGRRLRPAAVDGPRRRAPARPRACCLGPPDSLAGGRRGLLARVRAGGAGGRRRGGRRGRWTPCGRHHHRGRAGGEPALARPLAAVRRVAPPGRRPVRGVRGQTPSREQVWSPACSRSVASGRRASCRPSAGAPSSWCSPAC